MSQDIPREDFSEADYARFSERLEESLEAMATVLARPGFGAGPTTLGAELEVAVIDEVGRPLPVNRAVLAGAALMSVAFAGYGLAPAAAMLIPVSIAGGVGNGLVNVCVATLVMTRSDERVRGRVSAALGAVVNGAGIVSLVAGGGLAAVLDPRQIFLLASALAAVVTVVTAVRITRAVRHQPARDISLGAELSRI